MEIWITPPAPGEQVVRISVPLPAGFLRDGQTLRLSDGGRELPASVRVLTRHVWDGSARRALVSFIYGFPNTDAVRFQLLPVASSSGQASLHTVSVRVRGEEVHIVYRDGVRLIARLIAPARRSTEPVRTETVEENDHFLWQRVILPDAEWSRIIEVRADALGIVAVVAHLQRRLSGNGYAPPFGWELEVRGVSGESVIQREQGTTAITSAPIRHPFAEGKPCALIAGGYRIYHPCAPFQRRGAVEVWREADSLRYRYWRCLPDEKVPMQSTAWRRAEFVVAPASLPEVRPTLQYPHALRVSADLWRELYGIEPLPALPAELEQVVAYHREAILRCVAVGDDWGNITAFHEHSPAGAVYGMNRLNHCAPIFAEAYLSGDTRLLDTALLWCQNFTDLSIWWGDEGTGGTRYPNILSLGQSAPDDDRTFMWRSNSAVNFCTKGFDAFFIAYEETGDPRMQEALDAQVAYASKEVHAHQGECRNVGIVRDFVCLYRFTGDKRYLDQALRLFRELRTKLWENNLFDQGGKPPTPDLPFFDDDATGSRYGYAKPYIIGYALAGLPLLLRQAPREPRLRAVVQAVADFLAGSQDPLGGWRYPHPRSSAVFLSQAIEHAWQLVQADRATGVKRAHLDAIERVLRQRISSVRQLGTLFSELRGWEWATGRVKTQAELNTLYQRPEERDFTRDYDEGQIMLGSAPPEGLVYFPEVLWFYLQHRPASRLLALPDKNDPSGKVLDRALKQTARGRAHAGNSQEDTPMQVVATNPNPRTLPTLSVWEDETLSPGRKLTMVAASFPNVPGFTCDAWCYESDMDFVDARVLSGGRLQLQHRWRARPEVLLVTIVTPEPGAVEFVAHLEHAERRGDLPAEMPFVNMCWQVRRAPSFCSAPDPYPEFVKRCFIFTAKGRTFLHETTRRPIPVRPANDAYNNPPWVQMYAAAWLPLPQASRDSWADYSPDQYTVPVIGVVSRDGRYLAALANDSATVMAQAWHDCLHNNPPWLPADAPPAKRRWRLKVYAMRNDPAELLRRVGKDFPNALKHVTAK